MKSAMWSVLPLVMGCVSVSACGSAVPSGSGGASVSNGASSASSGSRAASSGMGGTGGGGSSCNGNPLNDSALISDACGVFVAAGASGSDGTQESPLGLLSLAYAKANMEAKTFIFVCAGTYAEKSTVTIGSAINIYGNLTGCRNGDGGTSSDGGTGWTMGDPTQAANRATLTGPADSVALLLQPAMGTVNVYGLDVVSPGATKSGGSSITVLASGGALIWTYGSITAGDAKSGNPGTTPAVDPTLDGINGTNGANTCDPGLHVGPMGMTKTCTTGGSSTGGNGGTGGQVAVGPPAVVNPASNGTAGVANPVVGTSPSGNPGSGEGQGTPPSAACSNGVSGTNGPVGSSGVGGMGIGAIAATGYHGSNGKPGGAGGPGQGGGGGGGAKGAAMGTCGAVAVVDIAGASGGAGGTGGCGGTAGTAGTAGGSSIALLLIDVTVTLGSGVTLTAGAGGVGGQGGSGQNGGATGLGGALGNSGPAANNSCQGGNGGKGGAGGPGGGGQGGHSLGIAFQSTTAAAPAGLTSTVKPGNPGAGGAGGTANTAANGGKGDSGIAAKCWDFSKNAACM